MLFVSAQFDSTPSIVMANHTPCYWKTCFILPTSRATFCPWKTCTNNTRWPPFSKATTLRLSLQLASAFHSLPTLASGTCCKLTRFSHMLTHGCGTEDSCMLAQLHVDGWDVLSNVCLSLDLTSRDAQLVYKGVCANCQSTQARLVASSLLRRSLTVLHISVNELQQIYVDPFQICLLYTSPSPRDRG